MIRREHLSFKQFVVAIACPGREEVLRDALNRPFVFRAHVNDVSRRCERATRWRLSCPGSPSSAAIGGLGGDRAMDALSAFGLFSVTMMLVS